MERRTPNSTAHRKLGPDLSQIENAKRKRMKIKTKERKEEGMWRRET